MKPAKYIIAAMILSGSVSLLDVATVIGAGKGSGGQHGGKAAEHMSSKGAANTNAQWSADPEKGWVRASERHETQQQNGSVIGKNENNGKKKGKDKGKKL
jgi:hypothetical protein